MQKRGGKGGMGQLGMTNKSFTIIGLKNFNGHTLPMSNYLFYMLARRKPPEHRDRIHRPRSKAVFVFPLPND